MTGKLANWRWIGAATALWGLAVLSLPARGGDVPGGDPNARSSDGARGELTGAFVYVASGQDEGERLPFVDPTTAGIANVVVYALHVRRTPDAATSEENFSVEHALYVARGEFFPHLLPLQVGDSLVLRNADARPHALLIRPPLGPETHVLLGPGDEHRVWFHVRHYSPAAVTCSLHPDERAYVFAVPHPYLGITDSNGTFRIRDLPAGEPLMFQVWHERSADLDGWLAAKPEWPDGRFTARIPAQGTADLGRILVPRSAFDARR